MLGGRGGHPGSGAGLDRVDRCCCGAIAGVEAKGGGEVPLGLGKPPGGLEGGPKVVAPLSAVGVELECALEGANALALLPRGGEADAQQHVGSEDLGADVYGLAHEGQGPLVVSPRERLPCGTQQVCHIRHGAALRPPRACGPALVGVRRLAEVPLFGGNECVEVARQGRRLGLGAVERGLLPLEARCYR